MTMCLRHLDKDYHAHLRWALSHLCFKRLTPLSRYSSQEPMATVQIRPDGFSFGVRLGLVASLPFFDPLVGIAISHAKNWHLVHSTICFFIVHSSGDTAIIRCGK